MPVAVTMAGGYALRIGDTVAIHLETVRIAAVVAEAIAARTAVEAGELAL